MSRITDKIDSQWISEIDGKPTFRGIIDDYLDEEKIRWRNETTIKNYGADFNNKILPNLANHNDKTIDQYIKDDFDQVIQTLKEAGKSLDKRIFQPYADSTIQHFRHIVYVIVKVAVEANLCEDILWGTEYALSEEEYEASSKIEESVRLKKSFTPEEEKKIAKAIFSNPQQRGQEMGILLMDALGLRNNEACGADFGCIKPMDGHPELYEMWVYQTTKSGTSVLGSSGKTKNADRIIPIPDLVLSFLWARRDFVEAEMERIAAERGIARSELPSIDELPIACYNENYTERCAARHLTAASKELFKSIKISEKMIAYVDKDLHHSEYSGLKEKDATAYTFRRNFGTHLYILGLDQSEIQYIIGHDVEDPYETRNEYVNEDRRYKIWLKMALRPIFNSLTQVDRFAFSNDNTLHQISAHDHIRMELPVKAGDYQLVINSKEPNAKLNVSLSLSSSRTTRITATHLISGKKLNYERSIDIVQSYQNRFK